MFPQAIIGIGLNYINHALETGRKPPEFPMCFYKNPASVCGPYDTIMMPKNASSCSQIDYEAELAVIIGLNINSIYYNLPILVPNSLISF